MIRGKCLSLSLLFVLGACANVPMAPPQADQDAKRFDQPAPDKGALYIYRPGVMGFAKPIDVAIVGGATAQLNSYTYMRLEGPPGPVEIDCRVGDNNGLGQVEIQRRPDALCRGVDEDRPVAAGLRDRRGPARPGPGRGTGLQAGRTAIESCCERATNKKLKRGDRSAERGPGGPRSG